MKLRLHTQPEVPLEAETISPDQLAGKSEAEASALPLYHGKEQVALGDFFTVTGPMRNGAVEVEGDLSRVKLLGHAMSSGRLHIRGNVGAHLGAEMSGGEIAVDGDAGDWLGREMSGGRITVKGNAGHMVGGAVRGSAVGIQGGEIIVHGNAGNEIGHGMRRGLIAIGGDAGDFAGVNMKAGTVIVLGHLGIRPGAGMKRGSIVSGRNTELLPTFSYDCVYQPTFLRYYLFYLRRLGLAVENDYLSGPYQRWSGDGLEMNRGEILLYAGPH
ncbi:MAG TPA: formylmethanofuran dehydrogenase subunit C [Methylococcaceae bacterium]|nr:formylmethanofuran dehydrogenase subunit C [Methylococcaceae bacterium]